ncbi:hypothetical protein PanWU01x14_135770, partial [Parasponia andersonii]
ERSLGEEVCKRGQQSNTWGQGSRDKVRLGQQSKALSGAAGIFNDTHLIPNWVSQKKAQQC